MLEVPLYPTPPMAAVELVEPLCPNTACDLCPMAAKATTVCMPPEGSPGGLLVVGQYPGRAEDRRGRPMFGPAGRYLRGLLKQMWSGPVAYDHAIRCTPRSAKQLKPVHIAACRSYLARTLLDARPTRILVLGGPAALGIFGRAVPMQSCAGGYSYVAGVPAFFLYAPTLAARNRHVQREFERLLGAALSCPDPPKRPLDGVAYVIEDEADSCAAVELLRAAPWVAYDLETDGLIGDGIRTVSAAFAPCGSSDAYVWDDVAFSDALDPASDLAQYLADPSVKLVAHNDKFDSAVLAEDVCIERPEAGPYLCTRLARRLLDASALSRLGYAAELVGMGGHKAEAEAHVSKIKAQLKKADKAAGRPIRPKYDPFAYAPMPPDVLARYNALDAVSTARLAAWELERLRKDREICTVWTKQVRAASWAFSRIERWGVRVDRVHLEALKSSLETGISVLLKRFSALGDFNPRSTPQLCKVLYGPRAEGGFGLKTRRRTDGGALSTDKKALAQIKSAGGRAGAFVRDLIEFRRLGTLLGTFVSGLIPHIRPSGRVHTNYNLDGTETGRPSSDTPNLNNIPKPGTPEGKMIRDCYVAGPGNTLLQGDLSQAELRVGAGLSGDPAMMEIFASGDDYHLRTARLIAKAAWGISPDDVTKVHRDQAKIVNFSLAYGKSDRQLAEDLGVKVEVAERIRLAILGKLQVFTAWIKDEIAGARKTGYVRTRWEGQLARRRPVFAVADADDGRRAHAERGAGNMPIQGTASDFCLAALVDVVRWIVRGNAPAKVVLTVYDSIVLEVAEDFADVAAVELKRLMELRDCNGVAMVADIEIGHRWGSLKKWIPSSERCANAAIGDA